MLGAFEPCASRTMAQYDATTRRAIVARALEWEHSVLHQLHKYATRWNPSAPAHPIGRLPSLTDVGCAAVNDKPWAALATDNFGGRDRHPFDLWRPLAPCVGQQQHHEQPQQSQPQGGGSWLERSWAELLNASSRPAHHSSQKQQQQHLQKHLQHRLAGRQQQPGGGGGGGGGATRDDGKRSICSWDSFAHRQPCRVYSVGSKGEQSFEVHVLNSTAHCEVHTFDCTLTPTIVLNMAKDSQVPGARAAAEAALAAAGGALEAAASVPLRGEGGRHTFHPWCLGQRTGWPRPTYKTLADAMRALGHAPGSLSLLKMDIEGWEHEVLDTWRADDPSLPEQLLAEVHCTRPLLRGRTRWLSAGELTALLHHLHLLGYRLADMVKEGGGVDATFVRAVCPRGMRSS